MWEVIKKAIVELLWPVVRDLVVQLAKELSIWVIHEFREWAGNRNERNAREAETRAADFERNAKVAPSPQEAEMNSRIAEVWREVAEKFRAENEALASEVERLKAEASSKATRTVQSLSFDDAIEDRDGNLSLRAETPFLK